MDLAFIKQPTITPTPLILSIAPGASGANIVVDKAQLAVRYSFKDNFVAPNAVEGNLFTGYDYSTHVSIGNADIGVTDGYLKFTSGYLTANTVSPPTV